MPNPGAADMGTCSRQARTHPVRISDRVRHRHFARAHPLGRDMLLETRSRCAALLRPSAYSRSSNFHRRGVVLWFRYDTLEGQSTGAMVQLRESRDRGLAQASKRVEER